MNIEIFTLCDAAVESNGRLNLFGTIDYFWAPNLPFLQTHSTAVARLRFEEKETGLHHVGLDLIDDDGAVLFHGEEVEVVVVEGSEGVPVIRHLLWPLKEVRFERYGEYALQLKANGRHCATLPIPVLSPHQVANYPLVPS